MLEFTQGIFSRVENMSVQAIELSKGDIAQGVDYPMLCRVHILHHCSRINKLSGCSLHEILNSFFFGMAKWRGFRREVDRIARFARISATEIAICRRRTYRIHLERSY
jgi:hypothetical protein